MENRALAQHLKDHFHTLTNAERSIVLLRWFPLENTNLKGKTMTVDQAIDEMKKISFLRLLPKAA